MTDEKKPTYIVYKKGWDKKPCPHCGKPAVIHGWLYWEKDADGNPQLKIEVWEHEDGSRHQLWKPHGVPKVEFKKSGED